MVALCSVLALRICQCRSAFQPLWKTPPLFSGAARPNLAARFHLWSRATMKSSSQNNDLTKNQHHLPPGKLLTLPTLLTVSRVVAVPVFAAAFFSNGSWSTVCTTSIFIAAAFTDWLDGYLARKMKLSSAFGAFLDPVADKLMVATALVLLCTRPLHVPWLADMPWLLPLPAVLMISREIVVSALREWAAVQGKEFHKAVSVDKMGKLKTATQMVGIAVLLGFGNARSGMEAYLATVGVGVLHLSTGLALWSLGVYMRRLLTKISTSR